MLGALQSAHLFSQAPVLPLCHLHRSAHAPLQQQGANSRVESIRLSAVACPCCTACPPATPCRLPARKPLRQRSTNPPVHTNPPTRAVHHRHGTMRLSVALLLALAFIGAGEHAQTQRTSAPPPPSAPLGPTPRPPWPSATTHGYCPVSDPPCTRCPRAPPPAR